MPKPRTAAKVARRVARASAYRDALAALDALPMPNIPADLLAAYRDQLQVIRGAIGRSRLAREGMVMHSQGNPGANFTRAPDVGPVAGAAD